MTPAVYEYHVKHRGVISTPVLRRLLVGDRYRRARRELGDDHPRTVALHGRVLALRGEPNVVGSRANYVAWMRARGVAGFGNRAARAAGNPKEISRAMRAAPLPVT